MKNFKLLLLLSILILSSSFILFKKKDKPMTFNPKMIEKSLGEVSPNLYASNYEVNNLFYQEFLNDLKNANQLEDFEKADIRKENWNENAEYNSPVVNTYSSHPAYHNFPVVNITQDGARMFCQWLTKKYNATAKRKYKKVLFRLPSEEEWKTAARANYENAPFPWGGYYLRNSKGKFLANFKRIPQIMIKRDRSSGEIELNKGKFSNAMSGVSFPAPVKAYLPNDLGFYQMSGNVAEMLQEDGRTKGGSWASTGYYITIDAEDEYEGFTEASPMIGFRYFMEIVEE